MLRLLRNPAFISVALGHFVVDALSAQVGLLLAVLSGPLGLSNAAIGGIATAFSFLVGVSQPAFGWLTDRFGDRWTSAGGVMWIAGCFSLAGLVPTGWAPVAIVAAAPGSGALHPSGAARTSRLARLILAGEAATATSIFILFGQVGYAIGPAAGGVLLENLGRNGILILSLPGVLVGLVGLLFLHGDVSADVPVVQQASPEAGLGSISRSSLRFLALVLGLSGLRTWAEASVVTFIPKLYHDRGFTPTHYGLVLMLFVAGMAVGGVAGGILGDRWDARRTVGWGMALGVLPFLFFPVAATPLAYLLILLAGIFNGAPHSVLLTSAQSALPGRGGMATGLAFGSMFAIGALGVSLSGLIADRIGLAHALQINAGLCLAAVILSLRLRRDPLEVIEVDAEPVKGRPARP